ncbi:hypothetical protein OS493_019026 [Desmophyllum pertusum]|uniref:Arrestin C-terminal-like domain-containing protein n=1 Tax=Desmophyllum pertusum TaxID=174260 RepID=A0A9W9YZX2_9CNID|nr:hypothetical protein OS493_019026 [Desmophyllum pertusum]
MSEDRTVGCLCCASGPLSVTVYTDRGGTVLANLLVSRQLSTTIQKKKFLVWRYNLFKLPFILPPESKGNVRINAAMLQEGVKAGEESRMPMVPFPVPSLPPSMLSCRCMRMSYILRLKVRVKGAFNSNLNIPLTIGSVPFTLPMQQQYTQPAAANFAGPFHPWRALTERQVIREHQHSTVTVHSHILIWLLHLMQNALKEEPL